MKPEEFWGNPETGRRWLRSERLKYRNGNFEAIPEILSWLKNTEFNSILELGSGTGRIIGAIHKSYSKIDCKGLDINSELANYVYKTHNVKVDIGDIHSMPFDDKSVDMVYTFQVLQHVPPDRMDKIIKEMKRIAKKEIWLIEGWTDFDKYGILNGDLRHDAGGGTFYWNFEKFFKCYETGFIFENEEKRLWIKYYKIRLEENEN